MKPRCATATSTLAMVNEKTEQRSVMAWKRNQRTKLLE